MTTGLNLTLPEAPRRRSRPGILQVLTFLLAAGAVTLLVLDRRERTAGAPAAAGAEEARRLQDLGADLEKRTLYPQAADAWGEYLAVAVIPPEERGRALYRRAKCLTLAGRHAEAARYLTEAEGYTLPRDEKRRAAQLLLECLQVLRKDDAYDSVARAFAVQAEEKGTLVARVGKDQITREEIRDDLRAAVAESLKLGGAPLTPAELAARAAELVDKQMKDPEAWKRALGQAVSSRLLYREGLERGFGEDEATNLAVARFRRVYLGQRVIEAEVEAALKNLGATDLKNHYQAHKERFVEKPGVEFSFASFGTRDEAEAALKKVKDPLAAGEVGLERAKGAASRGAPVPGIGPSAEITEHLLALGEGEASAAPVEHQGRLYVFRVERKTPERQLEFEEAEPRVRADLAALKRQEAMDSLRDLLAQKFSVQAAPEGLGAEGKEAAPAAATGAAPPGGQPPAPDAPPSGADGKGKDAPAGAPQAPAKTP
jgi:hypothetical protein